MENSFDEFSYIKCDHCGYSTIISPTQVFLFNMILCNNCNKFIFSKYFKYLFDLDVKIIQEDEQGE